MANKRGVRPLIFKMAKHSNPKGFKITRPFVKIIFPQMLVFMSYLLPKFAQVNKRDFEMYFIYEDEY